MTGSEAARLALVLVAAFGLFAGQARAAKIDDAEAAFADDRDDDALALFEQILADPATDTKLLASAYIGLGELNAGNRQPDRAVADFTAALSLPQDPAQQAIIYIDRAEVLARQGKIAEAIDDYGHSLALAPGQIGGHTQRGALYQRIGNTEAALAEFDAELKIRPEYYRALVGRAQILKLPLPPNPEAGRNNFPDGGPR